MKHAACRQYRDLAGEQLFTAILQPDDAAIDVQLGELAAKVADAMQGRVEGMIAPSENPGCTRLRDVDIGTSKYS